ncbi:uncharacterized protein LOC113226641 [Hyposmocoma kahamanoa]|uniref:uncharacterized protein LOC113226641 n=1 Tax=Hyposmocoma kahamanoa TaxID=1477025 RepID=UPI000E6D7E51|nr:uncharacterized protein LOC113226641 [Hyposmocoma kahamanoa]
MRRNIPHLLNDNDVYGGGVIISTITFQVSDIPQFRILAPQFVCPKDENTPVDKPDNTVITLQTVSGADFPVAWSVRWAQLPTPTQRFTIMLWKAARALEIHLNTPPKEPYVYVIDNAQLLHGIDYIFNVSSINPDGTVSTSKSFHIDNTYGDQKLDMVEGIGDLLSIVLIGEQKTFADVEFVLNAQVTACFATQDYYFIWTIRSADSQRQVYVSSIRGSRLRIPPYSLRAGISYDVNCEVIKESTGHRITQNGLPIQVLQRSLEVFLNVDYLVVPVNKAFNIEALVINHDHYQEPISFRWDCKFLDDPCEFESGENGTLSFPTGLPNLGQYEIRVTAIVNEQTASATATLSTVVNSLPVIQLELTCF